MRIRGMSLAHQCVSHSSIQDGRLRKLDVLVMLHSGTARACACAHAHCGSCVVLQPFGTFQSLPCPTTGSWCAPHQFPPLLSRKSTWMVVSQWFGSPRRVRRVGQARLAHIGVTDYDDDVGAGSRQTPWNPWHHAAGLKRWLHLWSRSPHPPQIGAEERRCCEIGEVRHLVSDPQTPAVLKFVILEANFVFMRKKFRNNLYLKTNVQQTKLTFRSSTYKFDSYFIWVLRIEPSALYLLSKCSTIQAKYPAPGYLF